MPHESHQEEEGEEEEVYKLLPANKADHLCHRRIPGAAVYATNCTRQSANAIDFCNLTTLSHTISIMLSGSTLYGCRAW